MVFDISCAFLCADVKRSLYIDFPREPRERERGKGGQTRQRSTAPRSHQLGHISLTDTPAKTLPGHWRRYHGGEHRQDKAGNQQGLGN